MKLVIIGSGNVAWHLTGAFIKAGNEILQVVNRTLKNAALLGKKFNIPYCNNFKEINKTADMYVIAVADDAIEEIVNSLHFVTSSVVHTSGSTPIDVFKNLPYNVGVFYPLQTFSKNKKVEFHQVPLCLEANCEEMMEKMIHLASGISNKIFQISSKERILLHVAAVFACNFSNHMMALGEEILKKNNLSTNILIPLIEETYKKAIENGPLISQTGPAVRNDTKTIVKHLEVLQNEPNLAELYKAISNSIFSLHK